MRTAAVGSALFFLVAPGVVSGLIPWLLTGWRVREPVPYLASVRVLGTVLLLAGLIVLIAGVRALRCRGPRDTGTGRRS